MWVCVAGIFSIVFLETIALLKGINGLMFGSSMTAIGGLVGYWIAYLKHTYKKGEKSEQKRQSIG